MKKDLVALILISTTLGALAQLLLKTGMNSYGPINFGIDMILAVFQPYVFIGLITYFISATSWIMVLSKAEVSYAYPFAALGYGIVALLGWAFLNETVSLLRIAGIGVIIFGVYIVGKSK